MTKSKRTIELPILLVEDKDSLRAMLRHALEAQGHPVIEARDRASACRTDCTIPRCGDGVLDGQHPAAQAGIGGRERGRGRERDQR